MLARKSATKPKKSTQAKRPIKAKKSVKNSKSAKPKKTTVKKAVTGKISKPGITVGQSVPVFSIASTGGKTVLSNMFGGKAVVLYFYPKDSTPGCTIEGRDFTRLHSEFKKMDVEVFGVSRDSMKSHEKFKDRERYSIDLLSDEDEALCQLFGVIKMKNMYGKQVRGIERSTFVLGRDGKLVKEWRGVKVPGHAEEVLGFVKSL